MFVGWLGISPEDYRCRFRACRMTEREWPFAWARQLEDAVARWLRPGPSPEEAWLLNLVVLKQFVEGLPEATARWFHCHCPANLTVAFTLAEDHLVANPGPAREGP